MVCESARESNYRMFKAMCQEVTITRERYAKKALRVRQGSTKKYRAKYAKTHLTIQICF